MNRKSGGCRGGEQGVMNYSSKVDDGRTGCQLTNRAEREEEEEEGREKNGKEKSFREDEKRNEFVH